MHGLSQLIETSETETEVGKTSTNVAAWALLSQDLGCLNEVDSVVVVFRHTSGNGKNIDIKDDILW